MSPEEIQHITARLLALEKDHKKTLDEISALKKYISQNPNLADSWESLGQVSGFYIDSFSKVEPYHSRPTHEENKNVFLTRNQAVSALAKAQLSQLLKSFSSGWSSNLPNYVIFPEVKENKIIPYISQSVFPQFLAFRSREKALSFYNQYEQLIQEYWSEFFNDETEESDTNPNETDQP